MAPNAGIYRAYGPLPRGRYLSLFFPPRGALKLAYGESTTALKLPSSALRGLDPLRLTFPRSSSSKFIRDDYSPWTALDVVRVLHVQ